MPKFTDRFWKTFDKVVAPVREQTIADDPQSRLARQQQVDRNRIQRVEHDPETGKPLLHFDVTVSSLGGHTNVPIPWTGTDKEDVKQSFIEWLQQSEWQTVSFMNNGARSDLTFRSSWVAGFQIGDGRRTP